ncbi:hypothetical protein J3R30DRAFT_1398680 [Lentinula aciculospora]|uniref:Uncharacterized protein n=1 Tax=Lentinula aciculospora TaxID=153920 RepID=A0A9W9ALH3_9AGAR|nr:hypothetical protein J3R30DRAFT_1398680 [Lentinula aciculospora]
MRNYPFLILAMFAFRSQTATSYPLNQSSALLKTRRFEFSPLFGPTFTQLPSFTSNKLETDTGKSDVIASSSASISAGGTASHRSGSSMSTINEDDETHSVIGTLPPLPATSSIPLVTTSNDLSTSTMSSYSAPTASATHNVNSVSSISIHGDKEWKVIGIGLIVIASIASMILLTVFFESWSGFVRDMCGRKAYGAGVEEMKSDPEEKTWQHHLSSEDGHRYPSASSIESINNQTQKLKSPYPYPATPKPLFQPPSYFRPAYDAHPLESLFRRPSIRTPIIKSPSMLPYS